MHQTMCCVAALLAACGSARDSSAPPPPGGDVLDATVGVDSPKVVGCLATSDCGKDEFCDWAPEHACGADHTGGTCAPVGPHLCPDLGFWVCGCDGGTYTNECLTEARGIPVAYGGPCRGAGAHLPCHVSADCPFDAEFPQDCVDDPTDQCDPADGPCPGVCVHGTYVCSATQPCLSQTLSGAVESPGTEVCVAVTPGSNDDPALTGRCIYTTRQTCMSPTDCGSGELCIAELGCDPATTSCPSDCVRP